MEEKSDLCCPMCRLLFGKEINLRIINDRSYLSTDRPHYDDDGHLNPIDRSPGAKHYTDAIYLKCPECKTDVTIKESLYKELLERK